jgi:mannose-6-phosphate isomerase-like protein (cupin superfamily)
MLNDQSRRNFLRTTPLAAAIGLSATHDLFASTSIAGVSSALATPVPFQFFTAASLDATAKTLQTAPGNKSLIDAKELPVTVVMTTETAKSAKEFEWHEGRDHILQIIEGSTSYEVGGTPKNGRNTKPAEWLAPDSEGSTQLTLKKGDMLFIPRSTPHRRSTTGTVTLLLISTVGTVAS